jgi:hypothetical protein
MLLFFFLIQLQYLVRVCALAFYFLASGVSSCFCCCYLQCSPLAPFCSFTCYFGANIRTVLVAAQAFAVIGIPLLLPTIVEVRVYLFSFACTSAEPTPPAPTLDSN